MARIAGVDIPNDKRVVVSLTYIFGIGLTSARQICAKADIQFDTRVKNLTEEEGIKLRNIIENSYKVEGELRSEISYNIKRLTELFRKRSGGKFFLNGIGACGKSN